MSLNRIPFENNVGLECFVAQLRSQILAMHNILEVIERTHRYQEDYVSESFKKVEAEIRKLKQLSEV